MLEITPYLDRKPRALSGGQRQRVAMGRAIVRDPAAFLFDEPLSNLDAKLRLHMRGEIKQLHQRLKTTSVYVTHDQLEAMTLADRLVVLNHGRIEQVGRPLDLYRRPASTFVAGFLGAPAMNLIEAEVTGGALMLAGAALARGLQAEAGRVTAGIRPEALRLRPAPGATSVWTTSRNWAARASCMATSGHSASSPRPTSRRNFRRRCRLSCRWRSCTFSMRPRVIACRWASASLRPLIRSWSAPDSRLI